jgi:hypothetical protein
LLGGEDRYVEDPGGLDQDPQVSEHAGSIRFRHGGGEALLHVDHHELTRARVAETRHARSPG